MSEQRVSDEQVRQFKIDHKYARSVTAHFAFDFADDLLEARTRIASLEARNAALVKVLREKVLPYIDPADNDVLAPVLTALGETDG